MRPRFSIAVLLAAGLLGVSGLSEAAAQVPTFEQVVGHDFGRRITRHHQMVAYLERLAEVSARVTLFDQGVSWEGRQLLMAVVTSPENQQRLEAIREGSRRLNDPRETSPTEASAIIEDQPTIVYLGGSIHGFELSGSEGLLKLLEHLTTRDDPETVAALENVVVMVDPMLNPDGRDAFAHRNHELIGGEPNPERDDWSNDFIAWEALQFRTGHYFFDTNRDWWAHTQRETRPRVKTLREWRPHVLVDLHEMSPNVEFYFDPATDPYGPHFPAFAREWFARFGRAYAEAFDHAGFEYMTRERYNYFYPGYTTSYGSYQGAVGMLYEQGSTRGLAITRADESVRELTDALSQQYTAAWTAVRTAGERRRDLLTDYYQAHRSYVAGEGTGAARYLLRDEGDPHLVAELVDLLLRNGIEVGRLSTPVRLSGVRDRAGRPVGGMDFPSGTFVIEAAQPRNRLVRVLLEPDLPIGDEFLAEARKRVDRGESPRFYDITAWSLPLLFNLDGFSSNDRRRLEVEPIVGDEVGLEPQIPKGNAGYAYVIPGHQGMSLSALYHLRDRGHRAAVTLKPSRIAGREVPAGSVVIRVGQNDESVHEAVREQARRFRLSVLAMDTGLSEEGFPSLGSGEVIPIRKPEIALLAGQPVHAYSFGWAWYTLDEQYRIPVTVRRVRSIVSNPLDRFNVLIIPHTSSADQLAERLGERGLERVRQWVRDGGSLVAIGGGVEFVREKLDLTSIRSWYDEPDDGGPGRDGEETGPGAEEEAQRFDVPGALLRAVLDDEYWLASSYTSELPVLVNSSRILLPPKGPPESDKRVVARYAEGTSLRMSGTIWPEVEERLPGSVFAYEEKIGRGRVILFAEDVNFRAYWRGADRLFLNAVVLGPSAP